jgi:hypothetical protein
MPDSIQQIVLGRERMQKIQALQVLQEEEPIVVQQIKERHEDVNTEDQSEVEIPKFKRINSAKDLKQIARMEEESSDWSER